MEDGALRSTVKQLKLWAVLDLDESSTPGRRVYAFSPDWESDLREAQQRQRPVELLEGQRALLIQDVALREPELLHTGWVVEFERQNQALVALLDGTSASSAARIRRTFEKNHDAVALLRVTGRRPARDSTLDG